MFLLYQWGVPAVVITMSGWVAAPASARAAGTEAWLPFTDGTTAKPRAKTDSSTVVLRRVAAM